MIMGNEWGWRRESDIRIMDVEDEHENLDFKKMKIKDFGL
jgi:hypothetical protein